MPTLVTQVNRAWARGMPFCGFGADALFTPSGFSLPTERHPRLAKLVAWVCVFTMGAQALLPPDRGLGDNTRVSDARRKTEPFLLEHRPSSQVSCRAACQLPPSRPSYFLKLAHCTVSDSNSMAPTQAPMPSSAMTTQELRSAFSLASIYALRMLGLFMVLPVFSLEARHYQGGDNEVAIGLAIGMYGLVQAFLQIPLGLAADRYGRKRVIVVGLSLLALGSAVAALADSVQMLAIGRGIQGGGAISAAVSALLADQTRVQVRTKGMALIGASIGLMFALSLGIGPVLNLWGGLPLIFWCTFSLSLLGMVVIVYWTPPEDPQLLKAAPLSWQETRDLVFSVDLLKLDYGVFILYGVQLATWMALPAMLIQAGVEKSNHGWFYLPAVLLSFVVMGVTLFPMERKGLLRPLFLSAIVLVFLVQFGFIYESLHTPDMWLLEVLVFLFFCGFNILEASQPSLASKIAPQQARGAALGVYNTLQSLGIFAGGAMGGWVAKTYSSTGLFLGCSTLLLSWVVVSWRMSYAQHGQPSSAH